MKAMIFAAGLGTRLGKITENIPKALVEIQGKTMLRLAVEKCCAHGFNDIIINVHHFADLVEEEVSRLTRAGFSITVSDERDKLLENAGGLFKARAFFDREPFLLYNVDIVSDFDITALYRSHLEKKGLAMLAVRKRPGKRFYLINKEGLIRGWRNISTGEEILVSETKEELYEIAFSSIHIAEPEIFDYMKEGIYTFTKLYLKLAKDHNIYTLRQDEGYWFDIGVPETLENARRLLSSLPEDE
jgi:N-acetyl-alpha-D-muramate 1-phosphate uridylyltransferase